MCRMSPLAEEQVDPVLARAPRRRARVGRRRDEDQAALGRVAGDGVERPPSTAPRSRSGARCGHRAAPDRSGYVTPRPTSDRSPSWRTAGGYPSSSRPRTATIARCIVVRRRSTSARACRGSPGSPTRPAARWRREIAPGERRTGGDGRWPAIGAIARRPGATRLRPMATATRRPRRRAGSTVVAAPRLQHGQRRAATTTTRDPDDGRIDAPSAATRARPARIRRTGADPPGSPGHRGTGPYRAHRAPSAVPAS